ncbi:MAG: site-2 protease family protein, partial [Xanthomonadales bacterium]|nr:site-2 protease family protein [Xanthomonadales bacterium]NIO13954.1 site-2 protease family protein [Xanthomonadales bacterium]NIP84694.1 site-2 protease family protein [Planctomycetales bacterium]
MGFNPFMALFRFLALLPALVGHEFAHAWSADRLGDPTPRMQGRLTLNPLAHLDPMGTLMILFAPIGWARPVQVNPLNFRDPARGMMLSTACGPASNLAQGVVVGLALRGLLAYLPGHAVPGNLLVGYLAILVMINFVLAIFNLIPLGPLDGHHIMEYYLPYPAKENYRRFNRQYGMLALFGLILVSFFLDLPLLDLVILRPAGL